MHRFPNKNVVARFRLTALLFCAKCLMAPAISGLLLYSLVTDDLKLTRLSMWLLIVTILIGIVQWMLAARTRCPLCLTPVLAASGCSKHRSARRLLGSYRLRVATGILFRDSFQCPYCHEPAAMQVRVRGQPSKSRHY